MEPVKSNGIIIRGHERSSRYGHPEKKKIGEKQGKR
jgi:hypothetical protein